jgi:hypothetical protein
MELGVLLTANALTLAILAVFRSTTAEQKDKVDADIWLTLARGKSRGKTAEMSEQASQTSRGQRNGFLAGFKAVTRRTQTR